MTNISCLIVKTVQYMESRSARELDISTEITIQATENKLCLAVGEALYTRTKEVKVFSKLVNAAYNSKK